MNEQSDTPRTDETEKIADKMDSPAAAYGFTLARLKEIEKELTAARAEIERLNFSLKQASSIYDVVTEQRDRLAHELERITITGSAEHCRKIADEALQSLTTNEKSPSTGATE
jgi:septal ring factor EnvC (AmiA/AmiB activator)